MMDLKMSMMKFRGYGGMLGKIREPKSFRQGERRVTSDPLGRLTRDHTNFCHGAFHPFSRRHVLFGGTGSFHMGNCELQEARSRSL